MKTADTDKLRARLAALNLSQRGAARILEIDERLMRKFAQGDERIPAIVWYALDGYEHTFCIWEDCDQTPIYCAGHAREYADGLHNPTPWCHGCGAKRETDCHCGPLAAND